jgi:hypothetical protein
MSGVRRPGNDDGGFGDGSRKPSGESGRTPRDFSSPDEAVQRKDRSIASAGRPAFDVRSEVIP